LLPHSSAAGASLPRAQQSRHVQKELRCKECRWRQADATRRALHSGASLRVRSRVFVSTEGKGKHPPSTHHPHNETFNAHACSHTHYYTHPRLYCCIRINSTTPLYASTQLRTSWGSGTRGTRRDWGRRWTGTSCLARRSLRRRCVYIELGGEEGCGVCGGWGVWGVCGVSVTMHHHHCYLHHPYPPLPPTTTCLLDSKGQEENCLQRHRQGGRGGDQNSR
jgi:hypothetical protein